MLKSRRRHLALIAALILAIAFLGIADQSRSQPDALAAECATIETLAVAPPLAKRHRLGSHTIALKTAAGASALVENRLIEQLLIWISKNTNYDISMAQRHKPSVSFCNFGEHLDYEGTDLVVEQTFAAVYDIKRRHIYLVVPWSADDPENVGTLLHELIHDVQHLNREWPCWGRAEWQAYKLQEKWLSEQSIDPGFDWFQIFLNTRCSRDVHP